MRSANDHRNAAPTELARKGVSVKSGWCRGRDRHEVCCDIEPHRLDDFVRMRDRVLARREGREQRHRELRELNQTAAAQASRLGRLGGDQVNSHEAYRTGRDLARASSR